MNAAYEFVAPPEAPYTIKEPPQREWVRAGLAVLLVLIFAGEVAFSIDFLWHSKLNLNDAIAALKELAALYVSPTVALVGAATGFYFGRST